MDRCSGERRTSRGYSSPGPIVTGVEASWIPTAGAASGLWTVDPPSGEPPPHPLPANPIPIATAAKSPLIFMVANLLGDVFRNRCAAAVCRFFGGFLDACISELRTRLRRRGGLRSASIHMHVPPVKAAIVAFEQKLSDWLPSWTVQHDVLPGSVQSPFDTQSRTVSVPVQLDGNDVAHSAPAVHVDETLSVLQAGMVPPFKSIVAQQTGEEEPHPAGLWHASAASTPPPPLSSACADAESASELLPLPLSALAAVVLPPPPPVVLPPPPLSTSFVTTGSPVLEGDELPPQWVRPTSAKASEQDARERTRSMGRSFPTRDARRSWESGRQTAKVRSDSLDDELGVSFCSPRAARTCADSS